jgi:hypothetical protein
MFLSDKLMERVKLEELPFHAVTGQNLTMPRSGAPDPPRTGKFSSPMRSSHPRLWPTSAQDAGIQIEPAWKVSLV